MLFVGNVSKRASGDFEAGLGYVLLAIMAQKAQLVGLLMVCYVTRRSYHASQARTFEGTMRVAQL